jgi:hypothetical protein
VGKLVVAGAATLLAVGVAYHEWHYSNQHDQYGPARVIALLALAVALLGAVQAWSAWNERRRLQSEWNARQRDYKLAKWVSYVEKREGRQVTHEERVALLVNLDALDDPPSPPPDQPRASS